jgi:hypothetical protein
VYCLLLCSLKAIEEIRLSPEKWNHLFLIEKPIKEDRRTLPVLRVRRSQSSHAAPQWPATSSQVANVEGATMLKQRKKVNFSKVLEWNLRKDEVASDRFGSHSLL